MRSPIKLNTVVVAYISLLSLLLNVGCDRAQSKTAGSLKINKSEPRGDVEYNAKERAIRFKSNVDAIALEEARHIQSPGGGKGGILQSLSLALDSGGGRYITDNNAHSIHYSPAGSDSIGVLRLQGADAKLEWPVVIRALGNLLFVSDNQGIKMFSDEGRFLRLLRVYYQINNFAVDVDRTIYLNPHFRGQNSSDPLIVHLDKSGKRIGEFGARANRKDHLGLDDVIYLTVSERYVVAAFKHQPRVQIYDKAGKLINDTVINHPASEELAALSEDKSFVRPAPSSYRLPVYIAGVATAGGRILALLDMPVPEIVEIDFGGKEVKRYRGRREFHSYRGFDCQLREGKYRFWVLSADNKKNTFLTEFVAASRQ